MPPNLIYVTRAVSRRGFGEESLLILTSRRWQGDGCWLRVSFRVPALRPAVRSGEQSFPQDLVDAIFLQFLQEFWIFTSSCPSQVQYLPPLPTSGKLSSSSLTLLPHNSPLLGLSGLTNAVCNLKAAAKSSGLQQPTEHMK